MFTIESMESMDVGNHDWHSEHNEKGAINPFRQDSYHMGTQLGTNAVAMFANFDKDNCEYLILVNTITGERLKVNIINKKE